MENWQTTTSADPPIAPVMSDIMKRYRALAPHLANANVTWKPDPQDGRQLEFYPPWQADNPNPGKLTTELYSRDLKGEQLRDAIAGDALHYLGANHPQTGSAIDPTYRQFKDQVIQSRTALQRQVDREAYDKDMADFGPQGLMNDATTGKPVTYDKWHDESRSDAYMRGGIFPGNNPGWDGYLTPEQTDILKRARQYVETGAVPADPGEERY